MRKPTKTANPQKQIESFIKKARDLSLRASYEFLTGYKASIELSWKQGEQAIKVSNLVKPDIEDIVRT